MFGIMCMLLSQVRHVWCQLCSGKKRPVGWLSIRYHAWRCDLVGAFQYIWPRNALTRVCLLPAVRNPLAETRRTVRGVIEVEPIAGFVNASAAASSSAAAASSSSASAGVSARRWQVPPEAIAAHRSGLARCFVFSIDAPLLSCRGLTVCIVFGLCQAESAGKRKQPMPSDPRGKQEAKAKAQPDSGDDEDEDDDM